MINNIGKVLNDVDLTSYNTYHLKSIAKMVVIPSNIEELKRIISYIKDNNIKYLILGNGSNVILAFDYFDGIIISLKELNNIIIKDNIVTADCGVMLPKLVAQTIDNNLKGLEWAAGIPGTLGGSIHGNAGAYLHEIMEYVISVDVLDENNNIITLNKDDITYSYRNTMFKESNKYVIISAKLLLENGNKEESINLINDRRERRMSTQPLEYPSAGSVFRNPNKEHPAGLLIEESNLKGYKIGGAKISDKHANFIINEENATYQNVIDLINLAKEKVKNNYDIELICEQEIIE